MAGETRRGTGRGGVRRVLRGGAAVRRRPRGRFAHGSGGGGTRRESGARLRTGDRSGGARGRARRRGAGAARAGLARAAGHRFRQPASLRAGSQGTLAVGPAGSARAPYRRVSPAEGGVRRRVLLSAGRRVVGAGSRRRSGRPDRGAGRAWTVAAVEGAPVDRAAPGGRRMPGMGRAAHSRGRAGFAAGAFVGRGSGDGRRYRRVRGCAVAQGNPLRDALRDPRRGRGGCAPEGGSAAFDVRRGARRQFGPA